VVVLYTELYVKRHIAKYGKFEPELRLPVMIFGGCLVPVGLLWYGWTSRSTIPWPSEVYPGVLIGCGMYITFTQSFAYIVDCYPDRANSAMAANGAVRSIFGASFPLFARYMFENLGVNWASTPLGILCLTMTPVPVIFGATELKFGFDQRLKDLVIESTSSQRCLKAGAVVQHDIPGPNSWSNGLTMLIIHIPSLFFY
jgi:hypothetical protein